MITLSNGDKWIINDSEWKKSGIEYKEACKGNIPNTYIKDFIEKLIAGNDDEGKYLLPRKLTGSIMKGLEGYWNANFDVYTEVLGDTAVNTISNDWSDVYEMPWGDVIVRYIDADGGGHDVEVCLKRFRSKMEYLKAVIFPGVQLAFLS